MLISTPCPISPTPLMQDNKYADFEASTTLEQKQYKDICNMHWNKNICVLKKKQKKNIQKNILDFSTKFIQPFNVYTDNNFIILERKERISSE